MRSKTALVKSMAQTLAKGSVAAQIDLKCQRTKKSHQVQIGIQYILSLEKKFQVWIEAQATSFHLESAEIAWVKCLLTMWSCRPKSKKNPGLEPIRTPTKLSGKLASRKHSARDSSLTHTTYEWKNRNQVLEPMVWQMYWPLASLHPQFKTQPVRSGQSQRTDSTCAESRSITLPQASITPNTIC